MKIQVKRLLETGILLGVCVCFLIYWSNDQRAIERIIQEIMEFDFSPREYPIDYNKYTEEADRVYREAFYKCITRQIPQEYYSEIFGRAYYYHPTLRFKGSDKAYLDFLKELTYYYFDFTGDGLPELIIDYNYEIAEGIDVLQYIPDEKRVEIYVGMYGEGFRLGGGQGYLYDDILEDYKYVSFGEDKKYDEYVTLSHERRDNAFLLSGYTNTLDYFKVELSMEEGNHLLESWGWFASREETQTPLTFEQVFGDTSLYLPEQKKDDGSALKIYEAFLSGEKGGEGVHINDIIEGRNGSEIHYLVWDVSGDGIPELLINIDNEFFYIYKYEEETLFLWNVWDNSRFNEDYNILENGNILTVLVDRRRELYMLYRPNSIGELWMLLSFEREKNKEKDFQSTFDEVDDYEFKSKECTMEECIERTRDYLYTDADGVEKVRGAAEWKEVP